MYVSRDGETVRLEPDILRIPLYATGFGRYYFGPCSDDRIIFPYRIEDGSADLLTERDLKREFARASEYLRARQHVLDTRKQFMAWYPYSAPRNLLDRDAANLLVPLLADRGLFSEFPGGRDRFCLMASGGFSIRVDENIGVSPNTCSDS